MAEEVSGPYCVAPADVEKWWSFVSEQLRVALRRGGAGDALDSTRRDLEAGTALLWLAFADGYIIGVAVTALIVAHGRKRCEIVAFAGELERCRSMLPALERYAAAEGCQIMRMIGRVGWRRALDGYSEPFVTMDKRL